MQCSPYLSRETIIMSNEQLQEPPLVAKAGEIFSCTNGHKICTAKVDIPVNAVPRPEHFIWEQTAHIHTMRPCTECGAPWFHFTGLKFHVGSGEWRDTRPKPKPKREFKGSLAEALAEMRGANAKANS